MAADKMKEILKHFPDLEDGWKEMEERFKKDPAEREMLSLKYREMLEREKNLPEPEFTKSKKAENTSKVTSKVASKVSNDLEEAANNAVIALVPSFGQKYSDGSYVSTCRDSFKREELLELFKAGAEWQKQQILDCNTTLQRTFELGKQEMKQQMMEKAIDVTVHIDAGGYPYIPQMELYDYDKDIPFAKEGDKYKVIIIKED